MRGLGEPTAAHCMFFRNTALWRCQSITWSGSGSAGHASALTSDRIRLLPIRPRACSTSAELWMRSPLASAARE
jgi:hypothetical protein